MLFGIFLHKENKKFKIFEIERDIKLKEIELDELRQKHKEEYNEALSKCEGEIRKSNGVGVNTLTREDKERLNNLFGYQKREEEKMMVEYGCLLNKSGNESSSILTSNKSFIQKLKDKLFA